MDENTYQADKLSSNNSRVITMVLMAIKLGRGLIVPNMHTSYAEGISFDRIINWTLCQFCIIQVVELRFQQTDHASYLVQDLMSQISIPSLMYNLIIVENAHGIYTVYG